MENLQLQDPFDSRTVKQIPKPYQKELPSTSLFIGNRVDWKTLKDFLKRQGKIYQADFISLIKKANNILKYEPNIIKLQSPVTIIGDIHGQYYDLISIVEDFGGDLEKTNYLFLGDYVDRGMFSCEVVILLIAMKITYPKKVYLLRGNHEAREITGRYGFKQQCLGKYNQEIYDMIMDLFDQLPLACIVNNNFFCVHGGISQNVTELSQIDKINRTQEVPMDGAFCDLLWADPTVNKSGYCKDKQFNRSRQVSYYFGRDLTKKFLQKNNLQCIIRAHQCQNEGYKFFNWGEQFPMAVTIFSAPHYADYYKNKGGIIKINNNDMNVEQYQQKPHPFYSSQIKFSLWQYLLPKFAQQLSKILLKIVKPQVKQRSSLDQYQGIFAKKSQIIETIIKMHLKQAEKEVESHQRYFGKFNRYSPDKNLYKYVDVERTYNYTFEEKKKLDQRNQSRYG